MTDKAMTEFDWSTLPHGYAARYDRLDSDYRHIYKASAARLAELGRVQPGDSAIDIGAGTGISTQATWTAMKHRGRVLAVDPSSEMLTRALTKSDLKDVVFRRGTAENLVHVASEAGFGRDVDVVISSFTYYYMYEARSGLHRSVRSLLRPGGRWGFNLTKYLGELKIGGIVYNGFSSVYSAQLVSVARRHGITVVPNGDERSGQFFDTSLELDLLAEAGFGDASAEAWSLPLRPSEAYQFTIDGFYRYGSRVTFAPELMDVQIERRIEILLEALTECADALDNEPAPHIANFVAVRTN